MNTNPIIHLSKVNRRLLFMTAVAYAVAGLMLKLYFRPDGDFWDFFCFVLNVFTFAFNLKHWEDNRKFIKEYRKEFKEVRRFRIFLSVSIKMFCPDYSLGRFHCVRFHPKKERQR